MNAQDVMTFTMRSMEVLLMVAAPLLLTILAVGLLVSILQAATQINEATLSFIPKLLAVVAVLVIAGPWSLSVLIDYLRGVLIAIPGAVG
jgi:flagellar biosynthesis protein FliQ